MSREGLFKPEDGQRYFKKKWVTRFRLQYFFFEFISFLCLFGSCNAHGHPFFILNSPLGVTLFVGFRIERFLCYLPIIILPLNPRQTGEISTPILSSRMLFVSLFPYYLTSCPTYFNLLNYVQFSNSKKLGRLKVSVLLLLLRSQFHRNFQNHYLLFCE